ncbi:MAG: CPBP family intramembrane metalloprotease [Ruminococcaceae bacterium]|nr:CPBP family intramembrane metalloprotease [Oscillospiraceae bacterium]
MKPLAANEYRYSKVLRSIGITLLVFLGFINLFGLLAVGFRALLIYGEFEDIVVEVAYWIFYAIGYLSAFMLPVVFLKKMICKAGFSYQPMRVERKATPWLPLILFAGIAVILATAYLNASMISIFSFFDFSKLLPETTQNAAWYNVVLDFLVICLVPAVCEEFLFRGAILTNLLPFGRSQAVLISALLFGLMHQNFAQFFYAFCAGIVLGLVYERTGNIWSCMLLHFTNNFFSTFESEFANAFGSRFSSVAVTILEVLVFAVGLISAIILIFRFSPRKQTFRDGIFGKPVPADDSYSAYPVPAKQRIKLFFNVPMIIFLVFALVEAVFILALLPNLT